MEQENNKKILIVVGLIVLGLLLVAGGLVISSRLQSDTSTAPDTANAGGCPFVVTKARAQLTARNPWTDNLNVDLAKNKSIRIIGFQCKKNAACDNEITNAIMTLDGAGFDKKQFTATGFNQVPTVDLTKTGKITMTVTYPGFTSGGCLGTATINVTDSSNTCSYATTKARVQLDTSHPWVDDLTVDLQKNSSIRLMGFQCKTNSACDNEVYDAVVELNGAGFSGEKYTIKNLNERTTDNPDGIPTVKLLGTGTIDVKVTAASSTDSKCSATAKVNVIVSTPKPTARPSTPRPKPTPKVLPKTALESDQLALISGLVIMVLGLILSIKYRQMRKKKEA